MSPCTFPCCTHWFPEDSAVQTVRLADLLDEAKNRCKATLKKRDKENREEQQKQGQEVSQPISEEEIETTSSIMGYAAVKYMDLKNNRKTDYK